jgi:phage-related protein
MPTVAELGVDIDADDHATGVILALDALLKELDGEDVDIDIHANTAAVQAKIGELLERLRELDRSDPDIDIDVHAAGAAAELAALRAELDAMRDESIRVRVNDREIRRARTSMNEFRNSAMQASRSMNGILAAVLGLGTALIPLLAVGIGGVMALAGALVFAGIGVGLFGAVAVTVFGDVGKALKELKKDQLAYDNALTDKERDKALAKMKHTIDGLEPATRNMVMAIREFQSAWRSFAMQFRPQIFQIASEGLRGIASLLPSLSPIVSGVAGAFLSLERAAIRALHGPFWQSFISSIGTNIGPIMNQLGRAIGNLLVGLGAIIMAFMPLTRDFTGGLLEMTQSFAIWAQGLRTNKGFQEFVGYIRENTPLVLALIGSLVGAFISLVRAGAPMGEALVKMATGLFDVLEGFQKAHPQAAALGLALLGVLAVSIKLVGPLLSIGKLFFVLGSAILSVIGGIGTFAAWIGIAVGSLLLIVAVIAAVVAGLIYAYTHFEGFRNIVNSVASAIADFAVQAYHAIVDGLGAAGAWLASTFGPAVQAVVDFVVEQFNHIRDWASENSSTFAAAWQNILDFLSTAWTVISAVITAGLIAISAVWNAIWPTLLGIVKGVWIAIQGVIQGAVNIILGIILFWSAVFAGDWSAVWAAIIQILTGAWQIISGLVRGGFTMLLAIAKAAGTALLAALSWVWGMVASGLASAWRTILSLFQAAWNAIRAAGSAAMNGIQNAINAFWSAVIAIFRGAWNLLISGLASAWGTIRAGASAMIGAVTGIFSSGWAGIRGIVSGAISTMVSLVWGMGGQFASAGASIMAALGRGIRSGIGNAVGAVRDAIGQITSLLPGSPAKTGPLSGEGYSLIRGQHFVEDLAAGISGRAGLVEAAARDIADLMMLGSDSGAAFDAIARGASIGPGGSGGTTITIAPGAVQVSVGDGSSAADARQAFDGAGDEFAGKLLTAIRRQ